MLVMTRMTAAFSAVVVVLVASSCAGSPASVSLLSQQELKQESAENLCNAWALFGRGQVRKELERRGAITPAEWRLIEEEKVQPGMSELAVICSWGYPDDSGVSRNQALGRWGEQKQFVFDRPFSKSRTVYIEGGRVVKLEQ